MKANVRNDFIALTVNLTTFAKTTIHKDLTGTFDDITKASVFGNQLLVLPSQLFNDTG